MAEISHAAVFLELFPTECGLCLLILCEGDMIRYWVNIVGIQEHRNGD